MVYLIKECVKINLKQLPLIVAQKNAKFVRDRHTDLQKDRQSQKQTPDPFGVEDNDIFF